MSIIDQEIRKLDRLAARCHKLAGRDKERATRDWYKNVSNVSKLLRNRSKRPKVDVF